MITKITPVDELKQIFIETLLNKTDKINDVSAESVLNGIAYGAAKIGQKVLTNISVIEGHLFPDTAYGSYLDALARIRGISPRFEATPSSAYVRLVGAEGTYYAADTVRFTSLEGVVFRLIEDVTIGVNGFAYGQVRSESTGFRANVPPLSINKIQPIPQGHIVVSNEYRAMGGRDLEDDTLFRIRIKESVNELARGTLAYLEQVFMKINPRVLRLHKGGVASDGRYNLIVIPTNGQDFTEDEFNELLLHSEEYLTLTELMSRADNITGYAIQLLNVDWLFIDVDFRVDINPAYNFDEVRTSMQIQTQKLFDYRFWKYGDKVEWENMLYAIRNTEGVRYLPDTHFVPRNDINVPTYRFPRVRGWKMRDLNGNVIYDNNATLLDFYYPNEIDDNFQSSVIGGI